MKKLLSTPLAVAVSAAFVITTGLSSCSSEPKKEAQEVANQQNLSPEEIARQAEAKKKAKEEKLKADEEKRKSHGMQNAIPPSGGCSH